MNGERDYPHEGENDTGASTTDHLQPYAGLDGDRGDAVAERLRVLAAAVNTALLDLAADVEDGEEISTEAALATRDLLGDTDDLVRRHLGGVEPRDYSEVIRDPREGSDMTDFREKYDLDYLRDEADSEEIAALLAEDVQDARLAFERVEQALHVGDLTDVLATDVWDAGLLLRAWGSDVLTFHTDRDYRFTREEAEALDRADEKLGDEGNGHA